MNKLDSLHGDRTWPCLIFLLEFLWLCMYKHINPEGKHRRQITSKVLLHIQIFSQLGTALYMVFKLELTTSSFSYYNLSQNNSSL